MAFIAWVLFLISMIQLNLMNGGGQFDVSERKHTVWFERVYRNLSHEVVEVDRRIGVSNQVVSSSSSSSSSGGSSNNNNNNNSNSSSSSSSSSSGLVQLAVVTLVLNQGMYLREWIEFHRLMGVQLFVIFDDNSTDNTVGVLEHYISSGVVILVHAKRSFTMCAERDPSNVWHLQYLCQNAVFNYALSQLRGKVVWMCNFDVDEFLWTPEGGAPLSLLLRTTYAGYDKIDITSIVFGTNNISHPITTTTTTTTTTIDALVIDAYTRRALAGPYPRFTPYDGDRFGHKSLYRPGSVDGVGVHDAGCSSSSSSSGSCVVAKISPLSSDIRMNHYQYKSRAEQRLKSVLNGNPTIDINPEKESVMNEVEDTSIRYIIPALVQQLLLSSSSAYRVLRNI